MQSVLDFWKALIVSTSTSFLWSIFILLEAYLWIPSVLYRKLRSLQLTILTSPNSGRNQQKHRVIIVGGSFAGLAALWELTSSSSSISPQHLEVILIEQRNFFEYTPGILRLFCDPDHFPNLTKSLPTSKNSSFRVIQGKVTSLFDITEDDETKGKVLTYKALNTSYPTRYQLSYDHLIVATGASYSPPITTTIESPSGTNPNSKLDTSSVGPPGSLHYRWQEWKLAHEKLCKARRVLILGGGAVGVELAAEIVDHNQQRPKVTLVDDGPSLVRNFPKPVQSYAHQWLTKRGADVRLGARLRSWTSSSCTMEDGTVLNADLVYVCFGGRPNSRMATSGFELDARGCIRLDGRLRAICKDTGHFPRHILDGSIYVCGDVSQPNRGNEKQAFQAELQGKVAARNIIAAVSSELNPTKHQKHWRYPLNIAGGNEMPLIFVLSLGRYDGVLGFNWLCIPGPLAAIVKWILEYTKVLHMSGRYFGKMIWKIGDAVVLFLSRTILKPTKHKEG